jgi:tRNA uridine 5-carbamoylmethylation protein Kti12
MFSELSVIAILQGCPGSSKSTLAKNIVRYANECRLSSVICSADDYFINPVTNTYEFDKNKLHNAHRYCKSKFDKAVNENINWIIVDNTNVNLSSIKVYLDIVGYKYKIVRPNTDWYFDAEECFKKNTHNVPLETIQRMIDSIKKFSLEEMRADIVWI